MPHLYLPQSQFLYNPTGKLPIEEIVKHDVAVVQRLSTQGNYNAIKIMKAQGLKLVYDLDDALWSIPAYNPAAKHFKRIKDNFPICISECGYMTVSTAALEASVRRNIKPRIPIKVVNNAVDFDMFCPLPYIERDFVSVGWAGTATHEGDIAEVFKLVPELLEKNEIMRFEVVGTKVDDVLFNHPKVKQRMFVPVAEYASRLASWRWDVALAPLADNTFNRCKSNIRILESAALGIPVLCSPVGEYKRFCEHDKELNFLICNTRQQWRDKITMLVNDKAARAHYGSLMNETAKKHYNIKDSASLWSGIIEEALRS